MLTKAVHCGTSIVDDKINATTVCLLQVVRQAPDAATIRDVQYMQSDL
jgi:hypothetical protein